MSNTLINSLREDLHARFDDDPGAQLVDRVLDETVEAKKDAVTMFRTVLIEREAVARLADRAGMADVHVLHSVENDCAALAA